MILVLVPRNIREKLRGEVQTGMSGSKIGKCKLTSITAKLWITSLNSHFAEIYSGTEYWEPERQRC
jgi:hypothetical protein